MDTQYTKCHRVSVYPSKFCMESHGNNLTWLNFCKDNRCFFFLFFFLDKLIQLLNHFSVQWKKFHWFFSFPHFPCIPSNLQACCKILQCSSSREIRICLLQSSCFYLLSLQSANANPVYTAWKTTSRPIHSQLPIVLSITLTLLCNLCLCSPWGHLGLCPKQSKRGFEIDWSD